LKCQNEFEPVSQFNSLWIRVRLGWKEFSFFFFKWVELNSTWLI